MTITDEQYADVIAALKRGDQTLGTIHVSRWCDGSTACAVTSEPHGHWRGGYTVDATEFVLRLLNENEALRAALHDVVGACDAECAACGAYYVAKKALDDTKEKP